MRYGYMRVSTVTQKTDRQRVELEAKGLDEILEEKLSGGLNYKDRPVLALLLEHKLRTGDELYCHSIDRLARNLSHLKEIADICKAKGVHLYLLKESIHIDPAAEPDSFGDLMFNIIGAFAQFERQMIRERQAEGIAAAKAKGRKFGRPIDADHEQIAAWRRENNASQNATAEHFKVSVSTVKRAFASYPK